MKVYTAGTMRARGRRFTTHPTTGTVTSVSTSVPLNSHWSRLTPFCTPISSRTGRRM